jgi:uncharacterized membrane protein YdbT with pleckstrin-like domain
MSYIKNNLKNNEKLVSYFSESFKSLFLWIIIYYIIVIIGLVILSIITIINGQPITEFLKLYFQLQTNGLILGVVILYTLKQIIIFYTTEYGVTNSRIISKYGLIKRNIEEINLSSIESINVNQTILGRLLNYGTIIISGRGTSKVIFKNIDNVVEVRKLIKNK